MFHSFEDEYHDRHSVCDGGCKRPECIASATRNAKNIANVRYFHALALSICEHHKRTCDGATCNIPLSSIRGMAEAAGVIFTAAEAKLFI